MKPKLKKSLLERLPKRYQLIGRIALIRLDQKLEGYANLIGEEILRILSAKTVCAFYGIRGELREPKVRVIAGNGTETIHKEFSCLFKLDVAKIMWSKGNVRERQRIAELAKDGERIVDMFAGIGYFCIPVAKRHRCKVVAIELNPVAIRYLKENIRLNKLNNIMPIFGDCRKVKLKEGVDRVLMGYLPNTYEFLKHAFDFLGDFGIIHYHDVFNLNDIWKKPISLAKEKARKSGYEVVKIDKRIVKQYAPKRYHIVLDLYVKKL